jgi:hypothetical protein
MNEWMRFVWTDSKMTLLYEYILDVWILFAQVTKREWTKSGLEVIKLWVCTSYFEKRFEFEYGVQTKKRHNIQACYSFSGAADL